MTQQDIINDNIIKQYEIRVQQDSERIHALNGELANLRNERDVMKDWLNDREQSMRRMAVEIAELENQNTLLAQKCSDYADQVTQCEIDRTNLVAMTLERDEFDEANKKQALALKLVSHRADELERDLKEYTTLYREYKDRYDYAVIDGTDLRQKLEQQEDRFDQLDGEYQDLVRICTALYRTDKEAIREMINESLGGDNHEKFKNHLGV